MTETTNTKQTSIAAVKALKVKDSAYLLPTAVQQHGTWSITKEKRDHYVLRDMQFGDRIISGSMETVIERAYR